MVSYDSVLMEVSFQLSGTNWRQNRQITAAGMVVDVGAVVQNTPTVQKKGLNQVHFTPVVTTLCKNPILIHVF